MGKIKDWFIRKLAQSFFLSWADGKKTEIGQLVTGISSILLAITVLVPEDPTITSILAKINDNWEIALAVFGNAGLQFGIEHKKIKTKLGILKEKDAK